MEKVQTKFQGKLMLAPGQHPHFITMHSVPTVAALMAWESQSEATLIEIPAVEAACQGQEKSVLALLCWSPGKVERKGSIVFAEEALTPFVISHECTHAAHHFVSELVMTSKAVRKMSEEEQADYYDEALATVQETLFQRAFDLLFLPAQRRAA